MPTPKPSETQEEFITRCMGDAETLEKYPENDQRYAVCISIYEGPVGAYRRAFADSYTDYPKQAVENAKIALRWAEENGWGECGTPVGKARANQLAKGEPITEDTIARMAGFERHRQNSQMDVVD